MYGTKEPAKPVFDIIKAENNVDALIKKYYLRLTERLEKIAKQEFTDTNQGFELMPILQKYNSFFEENHSDKKIMGDYSAMEQYFIRGMSVSFNLFGNTKHNSESGLIVLPLSNFARADNKKWKELGSKEGIELTEYKTRLSVRIFNPINNFDKYALNILKRLKYE